MALPLMLAGPILRRVEPTLVSVWVALSEPATVRITLWEGRVTAGSANPWIASDPPGTPTLRVGAKLHVAVATVKIPLTSPRLLQSERIYSYDVAIDAAGARQTLKSLGLLNTGAPDGKRVRGARLRGQLPARLRAAAARSHATSHRVRLMPASGQHAP